MIFKIISSFLKQPSPLMEVWTPEQLYKDRLESWLSLACLSVQDPKNIEVLTALHFFLFAYAPPSQEDVQFHKLNTSPYQTEKYYREDSLKELESGLARTIKPEEIPSENIMFLSLHAFRKALSIAAYTVTYEDLFATEASQSLFQAISKFISNKDLPIKIPTFVNCQPNPVQGMGSSKPLAKEAVERVRIVVLNTLLSKNLEKTPDWFPDDKKGEFIEWAIHQLIHQEKGRVSADAVEQWIREHHPRPELLDRFTPSGESVCRLREMDSDSDIEATLKTEKDLRAKLFRAKKAQEGNEETLQNDLDELHRKDEYIEYIKTKAEAGKRLFAVLSPESDWYSLLFDYEGDRIDEVADKVIANFVFYEEFRRRDIEGLCIVSDLKFKHSHFLAELRGRTGCIPPFETLFGACLSNSLIPLPEPAEPNDDEVALCEKIGVQSRQIKLSLSSALKSTEKSHQKLLFETLWMLVLDEKISGSISEQKDPVILRLIENIMTKIADHISKMSAAVADYRAFYTEYELALEEFSVLLGLLKPYNRSDLTALFAEKMPKIGEKHLQCTVTPNGMSAVSTAIMAALEEFESPKIGIEKHTYFESNLFLDFLRDKQQGIAPDQGYICEMSDQRDPESPRNILLFDIAFNDARMPTFTKIDIIKRVRELKEKSLLADKFVIIVDATLCHIFGERVTSLLAGLEAIQKSGEVGQMGVVLVQSGVKLYSLGLNKYNFGPVVAFFEEGQFPKIRSRLSEPRQDLSQDSINWFTHLFKAATTSQLGFISQLIKNGQHIYESIDDRYFYKPESVSSIIQVSHNEDDRLFILSLNFENFAEVVFESCESPIKSWLVAELCTIMVRFIVQYAKQRDVTFIEQDSFGFLRTNIGDCVDTIRITIGYMPEENNKLAGFLEDVMTISQDIFKGLTPQSPSLRGSPSRSKESGAISPREALATISDALKQALEMRGAFDPLEISSRPGSAGGGNAALKSVHSSVLLSTSLQLDQL